MTTLVVDASVTAAWLFKDQANATTDAVLDALADGCMVVPQLWLLEAANVTALALRRKVVTSAGAADYLGLLHLLPKRIAPHAVDRAFGRTIELAVRHRLTAYDAAYLELAERGRGAVSGIAASPTRRRRGGGPRRRRTSTT
jgi:predicted nucleic acid-binding protein